MLVTLEINIEQIINYISIIVAVLSLFVSILVFYLTQKSSGYLEVDRQYQSLLAMAITNSKLRDVKYTKKYKEYKDKDPEFYHAYCAYAYMVWNFIETIADVSKTKKLFSKIDEVWFPTIIEENRLHYSWFVDNERLFRKSFVHFIKEKINNVVFVPGDIDDLELVYPHYVLDFPKEERKDKKRLTELMKAGQYKLFLISFPNMKYINVEKLDFIGYIFSRIDDTNRLVFIDYIAICDNYRSCGYGSIAINNIKKKYPRYALIFEIEQSHGEYNSIAERRKIFYERNGALTLNKDYVFPTPDGDGLKMDLMIIPGDEYKYNKANVITFVKETIRYIHSEYSLERLDKIMANYVTHFPENLERIGYAFTNLNADKFLELKDQLIEVEPALATRDINHIATLIKKNKYQFIIIHEKGRRTPLGLCSFYETNNKGIFIDYLTIKESHKSAGLGSHLYDFLFDYFKSSDFKGIYFQTIKPKAGDERLQTTLKFVKKVNASQIYIDYHSPLELKTKDEYALWFISLSEENIDKEWMQEALKESLLTIYVPNEESKALVNSYLSTITDFVKC